MARNNNLVLKVQADTSKAQKEFDKLRKNIGDTKEEIEDLTREFGENSKEVKKAKKDLEGLNKAYEDLAKSTTDTGGRFEDFYGELQPLSGRLGELEDRLYELANAGKQNSKEFKDIQARAVEMRQTIIKVDQSVDDLADSRGLSTFGTQLGAVGQSLMTLDFERASNQAAGLAKNASAIDFGTAVKSIGNLGKTFMSLGKALLANPLFLIAAAVIGIGIAIKELLEELGLLQLIMEGVGKVFEWIMTPINAIIDGLKMLTDWLGWTDHAGTEKAKNAAENARKEADAYAEANKDIIQGLDNRIRMYELEGKNTDKLHKKKLERLAEEKKREKEATLREYKYQKRKGELDGKELRDLRIKAKEARLAYQQQLADERFYYAEKEKLAEEAIKDRKKRDKQAALELKADTLEGQIAIARAERDERLKQENLTQNEILLIKKQFNDKVADLEESDRQARISRWKEYRDDRLSAERLLQDLQLELMAEGTEKELAELELKYNRLREDTTNNTELTQSERQEILESYNQLELQEKQKLEQQKLDIERQANEEAAALQRQQREEFLSELEEWQEETYQAGLSEQERELLAVQDKYFRLTELAKQYGYDTTQLTEQEEAEKKAIRDRYQMEQKEAEREDFAAKVEVANKNVEMTASAFGAINSIIQASAGDSIEAQRKAFNANKAFNIANAIANTGLAVTAALTAGGNPIKLATGAQFIEAGIAAATGAAQIISIAKTKFNPSGGSSGGVAPSAGGIQPPQAASINQSTLFSTGGDPPSLVTSQENEGKAEQVIKAVVVESDITETTNKVNSIKESASL